MDNAINTTSLSRLTEHRPPTMLTRYGGRLLHCVCIRDLTETKTLERH